MTTAAEPVVPSAAALLDQAASRAGSSDWGDQGFVGNLELLLESCRETAQLNTMGLRLLPKILLRHLRNRLYVQGYLSSHPEAATAPISDPVIVTGLPRTGTTMLHNLLALDPSRRPLRLWEALHPVPAGGDSGPSRAHLVEQAESWLAQLYAMVPAFKAIHRGTAEGPEECDALLQNSFASQHFEDMFHVEAYSSWLSGTALSSEYAYYRLQLQVLASGDESALPWVLKSPSHLGHLDGLLAALPDAVIVHCHRDPLEAVASYASLVFNVRQPYSDHVSPLAAGNHALVRCRAAMDRALAVRESVSESTFVDVSYTALIGDPLRVLGELYEKLGRPLGGELESRTKRWLDENPQHRHGKHRYGLADFGLTAEGIGAALGPYLGRFSWAVAP